MKKWLALAFAAVFAMGLVGCSGGAESSGNESGGTEVSGVESEDNSTVNVDEGLLTVDITIPATFFEDTTADEIQENAKEKGFLNCVVNDDGSVTYTMTKSTHRALLDELMNSCDESIAEMLEGENAVASFKNIEHNDNMSEVNIYVDPDQYGAFDSMYALSFYILGGYYQAFAGVDSNDIDVVVNFIDETNNEILNTASYREYLENQANETEVDAS